MANISAHAYRYRIASHRVAQAAAETSNRSAEQVQQFQMNKPAGEPVGLNVREFQVRNVRTAFRCRWRKCVEQNNSRLFGYAPLIGSMSVFVVFVVVVIFVVVVVVVEELVSAPFGPEFCAKTPGDITPLGSKRFDYANMHQRERA